MVRMKFKFLMRLDMKIRLALVLLLFFVLSGVHANAERRDVKITKRYLNFPIDNSKEHQPLRIMKGDEMLCRFNIRLTAEEPAYWVFKDVSHLKGKTISIISDNGSDGASSLDLIVPSDTIYGQSKMYHEKYRPQIHYTNRRGWSGDPNGLVYHEGEWHIFYQHNPEGTDRFNMHWGHAVSPDLIHWEELPDALHMDEGQMFSGSGVVDFNNSSGFAKKKGQKPLLLFYTSAHSPMGEVQCIAYSLDNGRTFTKYEDNPILDSKAFWNTLDTRDPKVFWYEPEQHWVMVIYERDGHSIYNSDNMTDWTYKSHVYGFNECPELFELPVDGDRNNTKWVMLGGSGTYMVGDFDGQTFTPQGPKRINTIGGYAFQTFNSVPASDGRVIKTAWGPGEVEGMPFSQSLYMFQEQTLRTTSDGIRLYTNPVKEYEQLFTLKYKGEDLTMEEANEAMKAFGDDRILRVKMTIHLDLPRVSGISFNGQRIVEYDTNLNRLNGTFYASDNPQCMDLEADIYIDNCLVEAFIDGGRFHFIKPLDVCHTPSGYEFYGDKLQIKNLEVYEAGSIWNKEY